MFKKPNCPVIAIEEHYWDAELSKTYTGVESGRPGPQQERLFDLGALRLKEMDEAGIDMQVISHGAPSAQKLSGDGAVALVRASTTGSPPPAPPTRSASSASPRCRPATRRPPPTNWSAASTKHGFKGAMMHGLANGVFLDDKQFWPIYERAEKLDVPVYFHPGLPDARVMEAYYNDYAKDFPMVVRAAWGYTVETATTAIRMVLSGVFEKHPKLKVIIGHLGETLPFLVWRVDHAIARPGAAKQISFRDIWCNNFWITTSGNFSNPALMCCVQEMGVDRILFSVDWPFVANPPGVDWMKTVPLCDEDKAKILSGNAKRLLRI